MVYMYMHINSRFFKFISLFISFLFRTLSLKCFLHAHLIVPHSFVICRFAVLLLIKGTSICGSGMFYCELAV